MCSILCETARDFYLLILFVAVAVDCVTDEGSESRPGLELPAFGRLIVGSSNKLMELLVLMLRVKMPPWRWKVVLFFGLLLSA